MGLGGLDPRGVGSGSAFAAAGFGVVGAKAEVTDIFPASLSVPIVAIASAEFDDFFFWNGGPGQLRFTLNLVGNAMAPADPFGSTFAAGQATLALDNSAGGRALGQVDSGTRTATVTIGVGGGDLLSLDLNLGSAVALAVFGQGVSDFADTAAITRIEQLDSSGNFLRDITLTDIKGNVLGGTASTVPEPATLPLAGACLVIVGILSCVARQRAGTVTP